ncbi:biorientation of chromosomes in cell division protein 1-like 1 [Aphis gossypii]|uniref:biorientation of chromosomes in cell division protein 1-like 1 n=1 Tax=Aphis gossypii TaxID=80765 RepID=UPI0021594B32|nr:biorientation of chromosomes in cell division protein 1-like 1 [Aphis gossypii]XP_050058764.1 biorientation of chromosomes in cell division protein 1-like 1 [Aphis gossypii]XP_050058765.1 biorientation of chromosomes in cell division protein 1-like 1 [Aphis gossypii]
MEQKNSMLGVEDIVFMLLETLKSNGTFDEIRRHCVTDIDAKPTYQNWKQRIESNVHEFLSKVNYTPELNKNTVRERLRKNLLDGHETQDIEEGADRILTQVLAPRTLCVFEPKIAIAVDEYLGIKNEAPPIELNGADTIACDKTQKDDSKDLRSDVKKKSSSLCKEPKSLNGNQSDGENDTGECLKQKISQHKTKTSTSDKSKTSFCNHKSNTKDNICKNVVAKSKDINNKANNIIYKPKVNGTKSKEFIDKPKGVITKPKDVIDKSKEVINKPKNVIDKSKDFSKPKDIVEKSKNIINKTKDMVDKSKDKLFLSKNSNSNSSSHKKNRTDTKRMKHSVEEKKKLSSFCKEPKLLNSNRSDDESNAGGSSKQESTICKNKSSSTDKTKSSSSHHKSSRKDNTSTIVKKSKHKNCSSHKSNCNGSKRLKLSQPKTNKLFINNEIIEESKSEKLEEPEWNDFRSSSITNDEQDAANVLLSMSTISYESSHSEIITEKILFIENSPPITETLKTHKIENELKKENIDQTKILPSSNNNDIKENSKLKPINSEKSLLSKNFLKGVPTVPSHLFEKECSVNLKRYLCKNINIQSCPSNNVEITNEHQKSDEIVMDEKELKTLNVEVNLDPNENYKTNECNPNAILKVPKLKIKLLANQIDSLNKCKRKKHHKDKSKKLKLSKSLDIPSEDSVSKNIMFEKLDQKCNNNTEVKMNDSASTLSKQTSYKEIENNSVVVLDDDKSHCSFKGFSEAETFPCKNYKILRSVIKALQAKIHEHDVINDGFIGFTNVETHPCKHRDIVYAELIKLKDSISSTDFDFIGFSEEETQISNGHKYVIQQLELAKKQFGSNKKKYNGKIFNEVVRAYLYESHNDSDATSRAIYSKSINDDKKDCTTENNINNKHDNWVVEQEIKYKLLPVKVILERLGRMDYGCSSSKHVSDSSHVPI